MLSKDDILRRKNMRDTVLHRVRLFFTERGFTEFTVPLLARTPGMEPHLDPFEVTVNVPNPSRKEMMGLITSPEYAMKKLLGAGFDKIFTITPVFRNGESLGGLHLPEFTMLEWYAAGSYEDLMHETRDLLDFVLDSSSPSNWSYKTYREAHFDEYGEPHVAENRFFVTHFPPEQAALAKLSDDGTYAERFEAYADGMELCNGFAELTDAAEQRRRFEAEQEERRRAGKTVFPIDEELLTALSNIKTPVYGNAFGIDRLVMLKYGVKDIRDVRIFGGMG